MMFTKGVLLPEQEYVVTREKLQRYAEASGDHNPIHLDEEFAKSVGLPNVIAHGMYTMALAGEAIRSWIGSERQIIEFGTRFTKPVVVPAGEIVTLTFSGTVADVTATEAVIELSATCGGVKVLGQTKARIRL